MNEFNFARMQCDLCGSQLQLVHFYGGGATCTLTNDQAWQTLCVNCYAGKLLTESREVNAAVFRYKKLADEQH